MADELGSELWEGHLKTLSRCRAPWVRQGLLANQRHDEDHSVCATQNSKFVMKEVRYYTDHQ